MSNISVDYDVLNQRGSPAWFSDVYANIPTAGYKGRMFISTDTYAFYRDTGTGWDLIGGPGTGTITGSGATGQVSFFNGSSTLAGNNNLFWDNTNSRLGINTTTPGANIDLHGTANVLLQLNNTTTANSNIAFQNQNVAKWRIGNVYNGTANSFDIYNVSTSSNALSIDNTTNSFSLNGAGIYGGTISLKQNGNMTAGIGYTSLGSLSAGQLVIYFGDTNLYAATILNTSLTDSRSYTLPNASGTLALTSDIPSLANYVTLNTTQTISGAKTFNQRITTDEGLILKDLGSATDITPTSGYGAISYNNTVVGYSRYYFSENNGSTSILNFPTTISSKVYTYPNSSGTIALTSDLSSYLPLTGGTLSGLLTSTAFGTNNFSSGGTGYNKLTIRNTTAGAANGAQLSVGTDADPDQFYVQSFSTTFSTSGMNVAGGAVINGEGPGGLNLAATQSSIGFYTNGASSGNLKMTITSTDQITMGPTANTNGHIFINPTSAGAYHIINHPAGTGTGYSFTIYQYNGNSIGGINQLGTTGVSYNVTSDYRLKENITPIKNAIDKILKIKAVKYKWKNTENEFGEGFIAHELQKIIPYAVSGIKDAINEDGTYKLQQVDYSKLVPTLVKAIQELNEKLIKNNIN